MNVINGKTFADREQYKRTGGGGRDEGNSTFLLKVALFTCYLKVHKIEIFFASILKFVLFLY